MLAKWLNAGLDEVTRQRLLDALFWNAALQLRHNDPAGARITFDHVIAGDARPARRLLAHAGRWPGASLVVRLLLPLYRLVRAVDRGSRRAA